MNAAAPRPAFRTARLAAAAFAVLLAAVSPACGKKGPPRPPLRIVPAPPRDVRVTQVGDDVVISALVTPVRTDGSALSPAARVRVLRAPMTPALTPGRVSPRYLAHQFARQATVRAAPPLSEVGAADGRVRFVDEGAAAAPPDGPLRYLYGVQVEDQGRGSPLAGPLPIEMRPAPPAPVDVRLSLAEGEVRLEWRPGGAAADGPPQFNAYRRASGDPPGFAAPLNAAPIPATVYVDTTFRYGETYFYSVRAVIGRGASRIESAGSPEIEVTPRDVYPPRAPQGLAAAVEGGVIRLYWFPSEEEDLAGYRVYRRAAPDGDWTRIGEASPAEPSFTDTTARPGVRYDYAVTAIDTASPPNESAKSAAHSETLPVDGAPPSPGPTPGEENG